MSFPINVLKKVSVATTGVLGSCFLLFSATPASASHGQAIVSDVDGTGFGLFTGFYNHEDGSTVDHPWFSFDLLAGETITLDLQTDFNQGSYLWLYEVLDGVVEVGDTPFSVIPDLNLVAQSSNTDTPPGPFSDQFISFTASTSNQYVVQVDSWLGSSGNYRLSIICDRAGEECPRDSASVPEPTSTLGLLALGSLGFGVLRKQKSA